MSERRRATGDGDDAALRELFEAITSSDDRDIARLLELSRELVARALQVGADRRRPDLFLDRIHHYAYAGDTALHIAAAAHRPATAELLLAEGADVSARNRRGAQPLHYAADGSPGADFWDPVAQREVIVCLVAAGANANALDKSGVAPLHRAVRTRSSAAVSTLIAHGADPLLGNRTGSTPLHLAVQNTGRSDSGSDAARSEQARIIAMLLESGASPSDAGPNGKSVAAAASSDWIRDLLRAS